MFARWANLASGIGLVGACTLLLVAGRSEGRTASGWEAGVLGWSRALVLLAFASGLVALGAQTAFLEGHPASALQPAAILRVLLETQGGAMWLVRQALLLLLAAFLVARANVEEGADWRAARSESAALAIAALVPLAGAGHAAASEPGTAIAIVIDLAHLAAAGLWIGGLPALAALLRAAAHDRGADARPYAVRAVRRFSRLALASVGVLVATGIPGALRFVPTVGGLVGTRYGRLLLVKLALVLPILVLAWLNRRRLLPALAGDDPTAGSPVMRRLAGLVLVEALLGLLILAVVAAMSLTLPALHEQPVWPFGFRFSSAALLAAPDGRNRVLIGSSITVLGAVLALCALRLRASRVSVAASAAAVAALGLGVALPPLAIDAYPTTYVRPPIPYDVASIASGERLFQQHCAPCHGLGSAREGPAARGLPRSPADLLAPPTRAHTAGDLFWWTTIGFPRNGMPGFGDRLSDEERWDVVNFLRALGVSRGARTLPARLGVERPWLAAPDFVFGVGPMQRTLGEYRGQRTVLLVLYTLPGSQARLAGLAAEHNTLTRFGLEIIAVPTDAAPDALRRFGAAVRILYPIVTEGAADIVTAYRQFTDAPHTEFLIDGQGYFRTRWTSNEPGRDVEQLLVDVRRLAAEGAITVTPPAH